MKRAFLWILAGFMLLSLSGLSAVSAWDDVLYPSDYVTANITCSSTTGDCTSKMNCRVATLQAIPHVIWVTSGGNEYYRHEVDLAYGQSDEQTGTILLRSATVHAHLNNIAATGYSEFALDW